MTAVVEQVSRGGKTRSPTTRSEASGANSSEALDTIFTGPWPCCQATRATETMGDSVIVRMAGTGSSYNLLASPRVGCSVSPRPAVSAAGGSESIVNGEPVALQRWSLVLSKFLATETLSQSSCSQIHQFDGKCGNKSSSGTPGQRFDPTGDCLAQGEHLA